MTNAKFRPDQRTNQKAEAEAEDEAEAEAEAEEKKEEEEEVYSCLCHEPVMLKELRFYQKVAAIC